VNLLDQIDDRLKDPGFSLNRDDFEECSTSLLTDIYPNLVPISGGSDDGRDAEISDPGGTIGVLITSARDVKGVLANLRKSCRQMTKKQVPINRIILANLAEQNASKRSKIAEAARALGFEVVQIYPRPWYANRLRRDPDWRVRLLQLRGGTFTLARPPLEDLGVDVDATVGRAEELAAIRDAGGDVLVSGVPGVGKTHLVAQVPGVLFVEKLADLSRLADDLLESDPQVVALDDAGARPDAVVELQTIRRSNRLKFRIVAVCWPHEKELVADRLQDAASVEVGRMTKSELGEILRKRGITRDAVLRRILDQARGRPAWAVRLGDLLKAGGRWEDVLRGHSVRTEVGRYLRNSRISDHAYETLATVALLGGIRDTEFRALAMLQGSTVLEVNATLRKVAESGLLDADEVSSGADRSVRYTVQPELLAASLVADAYFSKNPAPHPLVELREGFPRRGFEIVTNTVIAELVGASHPSRPSPEQLLAVLDSDLGESQEKLLRYYAALGPAEANFVLNLVREVLRVALDVAPEQQVDFYRRRTAALRSEFLAEVAADSVPRIGSSASLEHLAAGACLLLEAGEEIDTYLKEYFDHVRTSDIGEAVEVADLVELSESISAMPAGSPHERRVLFEAAARGLAPAWEANYMAPDKPRSFTLKSFLLPANGMGAVANPILDRLEATTVDIGTDAFGPLAKTLETWVHAAAGYALPAGLRVSEDQATAAGAVARRYADILAATPLTSGTRRRLNGICKPLNLRWLDSDPLFTALAPLEDNTDAADDGDDNDEAVARYFARQQAREKADRERLVEAIMPYLEQPPDVLCQRLAQLQPDLRVADITGTDQTRSVFVYLAESNVDPVPWIEAALDHGLGWQMLPLVERTLRLDSAPADLLVRVLGNPQSRAGAIGLALECGTGRALEFAVAAIVPDDFDRQMWTSFVRVTPEALKLLNGHPNRQVAALAITCWAGWYDYRNRHDKADIERTEAQLAALGVGWTDTMLNLEVPNQLDEHALERGLVSLARTAPDKFTQLFIRHVEKEQYPLNDFDEWAPAAHTLDHDHKTAAWQRLNNHPCKREVFWVLAGKDTTWIADRLDDGSVPNPNALLGHVGIRPTDRPNIEEIAALFADRVEPERILASLPDTLSGDEVEVAQYMLDESQKLAESDNPQVRAVGDEGVRLATVRLEAAKKKAREAELRGEVWS
jgi:hypothetical protein